MARSRSIAAEVQALRATAVPELVGRYEELFGKPPRVKHRDWLWRRCAWKLQEQRLGGLSVVAVSLKKELIADLDVSLTGSATGKLPRTTAQREPRAGTTVTRLWKGQEVSATAVDGGWDHGGVVYRSLSAVAKAVTGSHWNGRLFFGLTSRKAAR